ncbi:DUF2235 domain-containing protein [Isoptericola sp. NEAU-Y5]|uniref:DUF2235 domain-containing protein n=1 Tax=Isoptericola luteus TaxID=2879484 RepID=A0ABS7ZDC8_9MICO|nr:DUF2235 domain-containing protein [Isoptericola sp. NEAU-Y5]MCA5892462.1 DUF2235 domain-containing protein [Isoptericola sp. NEAU-Y5]
MRRLVLCCDGTWNHAVNDQVSNIEKLARAVRVGECAGPGGQSVSQVVGYVPGVGARGYLVDQLLGGAFGYGFTRNVVDGYRFLTMNYRPGDEIVVVGYSRGAYTARSIVGMLSQVGLLRADAVDEGLLCEAERVYRLKPPTPRRVAAAERAVERTRPGSWRRRRADAVLRRGDEVRAAKATFKAAHGHAVPVRFLGVFDTVGALGVPGPSRRQNRFHDVSLGSIVQTARQALAIDERRITFAPCLWSVPDDDPPGRVEQVWFPGTHGDVGGGGARCGLSDLSLQWMADELRAAGVVFDDRRLTRQLAPHAPLLLVQAPPFMFRALSTVRRIVPGYEVVDGREVFRRGLRVLALPSGTDAWRDGVRLADTVLRYVLRDSYAALAPNLSWWVSEAGGVERVPVEPIGAARADLRPLVVPARRARASGQRPRELTAGR